MAKLRKLWAVAVLAAALCWSAPVRGQGLFSPGSGGVHRSMGGASTAMGADALGALYWNPAAISGLRGSEVVIGGEAIIPDTHLGSTVPAGAFGPLGPAVTQTGYTRSDSGVALASGVGFVYQPEESLLSYGMGIATLAAGGVNFPGDVNNPLLAPVGPGGQFLLGPQAGTALIIGMMPTVSLQATPRLAFGIGPMIDVSLVSFDPAFFGPTSQTGILAPRQFPTGSHTRAFWGAGVRGGFTYNVTEFMTLGFSCTSPQWFETWRFNARDANGAPIQFTTDFTLPLIFSLGLSYTGIDGLLLSTDVRYFDYQNTKLLGTAPINGGAGWDSIWAAAVGSRYWISDRTSVQLGYIFNQNPISDNLALFNTMLPCLTQHTISAGTYMQLNESMGMSLSYVHGFKNSVTGSIFPIGTSTTLDSEYDSIAFGIHIRFGGPRSGPAYVVQPTEVSTAGRRASGESLASLGFSQ